MWDAGCAIPCRPNKKESTKKRKQILPRGAHYAKSRLFSTTGSHRSQGPKH